MAATDLQLPPFSAIDAHGGAHVTLHHGDRQRVTVIKGDMSISRITVVNGTLMVENCVNSCWFGNHELDVDVVAPNVQALAAHGGGDIEAVGPFPRQSHLAVAAHGGGEINARAIPADSVSADAHGGGDIKVNALVSLAASAHGGGDITYTGNPAKVASSTHGGGSIQHE
ncbi:MAG TPA: DUF2807 domain-containing protein [Rhizomicrobium sp.]|nr:DUF2807 domain-containing protein [Rhizomicrobium sp.]